MTKTTQDVEEASFHDVQANVMASKPVEVMPSKQIKQRVGD